MSGIQADIDKLRDFARNLPEPDVLELQLLSYFKVTAPDFAGKVGHFTDGVELSSVYGKKVEQFDDASRRLVAQLRALQSTVNWIADQYDKARTEDQIGASDVDRQFNSGLTAPPPTSPPPTSPSTAS
jgi:hypothetical protein